jgi:hypothetical protein
MSNEENSTVDIIDSAASAHADVSRKGRRTTGVLVGAAVTAAVAIGLIIAVRAHGLPDSRVTGAASVPAGAPGSMLAHEQVPSWRPSTSATVGGGSLGALTAEQVPSWSPTESGHGQTYREQVPAGS